MRAPIKRWVERERTYLRDHYQTQSAVEMGRELGRSGQAVGAQLFRLGLSVGRGTYGHFPRGHRFGVGRPATGAAANPAYLWKPGQKTGHERADGAVQRARNGDGRPVLLEKVGGRWVRQHRHRWQQEHGPIPAGYLLRCRDGDTLNTDPANWRLVSKAENARLNHNRSKAAETTRELHQVIRRLAAEGKVHNSPAGRLYAQRLQQQA